MKFQHVVKVISNYCTDALDECLDNMGDMGFELTSVVMANNRYHVTCMYLFFKRPV